jgi:uncharacterized protein (TIGR03435 family)
MWKTYFTVNATIPDGANKADLPTMVQHLLEERFGLKYHHVTRQVAGYELVVAKSGAKVEKAEGSISDSLSGPEPGFHISKDGGVTFGKDTPSMSGCGGAGCWFHGHHRTMQALAADLAQRLNAPVANATGLQGGYDYTVIFTDEFVYTPSGPVPVTDLPNVPQEYPLLREAVKQQLGLEVRPVKNVSLDVVVLDSANKEPTEN